MESKKYNKQRSRLPDMENKLVAPSGEGRGNTEEGEDTAQNYCMYNRHKDVVYHRGSRVNML